MVQVVHALAGLLWRGAGRLHERLPRCECEDRIELGQKARASMAEAESPQCRGELVRALMNILYRYP